MISGGVQRRGALLAGAITLALSLQAASHVASAQSQAPAINPLKGPTGAPETGAPAAAPGQTVPVQMQPFPADGAEEPMRTVSPSAVALETGSGKVLRFHGSAANVFAADPKVAEVRPASPNSLFVFGLSPGHTTIAVMDATGNPIAQYEVSVRPSAFTAGQVGAAMHAELPGSRVRISPKADGVLLQGSVATPGQADQAESSGRSTVPQGGSVEDRMSVTQSTQVLLRVRIAEMDRNIVRELGINWNNLADLGKYASIGLATQTALANTTAIPSSLSSGYNFNTPGKVLDVNAVIDALATDQLVHILAEPNLVAMSGETASFLVGGEFPIPIAQTANGTAGSTITVEFKQYGVSLAFVPTVQSSGRIDLHVRPEVSQLTNNGAVSLSSINGVTLQIPALSVRRTDTTVELGSGQSFAIAGLFQDQTTLGGSGLPFLGDVPILGALFRSDSFQRQETELVIVVTPYIVRPVSNPAALRLPTDGWHAPSDLERILLLRQTARGEPQHPVHIPGDAGFMVE